MEQLAGHGLPGDRDTRLTRSAGPVHPPGSSQTLTGEQLLRYRERRGLPVPVGPERDRKRPRDGQFGVVERDRHIRSGIMRAVDAVGDVSRVGQGLEAVGTAAGTYSEVCSLSLSSKLSQFRYVGEFGRRSTITSKTAP